MRSTPEAGRATSGSAEAPAAAAQGDGMRRRVLGGVGWKIGTQVVLQGTRAAVAIVLARLLTPFDFGLVGLALVFATLMLVFGDLGLGSALVHRATLRPGDRLTVFWTTLYAGVMLALLGIAVSGLVADFFGEPEVQPLFMALAASFVLVSLGATHSALLNRAMNFRALEASQMVAGVAGGAVGVATALLGGGPWAIVNMAIATSFVYVVLLWACCPWRPRFTFSTAALRSMGVYSGNVMGYGFLQYFERNADNLLIGRFLGATPLGLYTLSYNLMLYPVTKIGDPVRQVLFPAFSRIQDDAARIGSLWIRVSRAIGAVTLPAMAGLIIVAPDFVPVVLGERWNDAVPIIQVLAWAGILLSLQAVHGSVLLARNRSGWLLRWGIVSVVAAVASFVAGLPWGVVGVATAFAIATTVLMPAYTQVVARTVGLSAARFFRGLLGVVRATVLVCIALVALRLWLVDQDLPASLRLVAVVAAGIALYLPLCMWQVPELRAEVRRLRPSRRGQSAASSRLSHQ